MSKKLCREFYLQDTIEVARSLLGKVLIRRLPDGTTLAGRIVETEAYLGAEDPACHSFGFRRTPRTETMYLRGGHSYVYFIYGMHYCFNVVTMETDRPEAVLIRALEPLEGLDLMKKARGMPEESWLTNGPARLCQALKIDKSLNAKDLLAQEIYVEDRQAEVEDQFIVSCPRIGIGYAHDAVDWPLRFLIKGNRFVSCPPPKDL